MDADFGPLLSAYREAWSTREESGRTDTALLFEVLESHAGVETWLDNPVGRELIAKKWGAGVPPWRLRLSLVGEMPALAYRATIKPTLAILRAFRGRSPER